jgi:hypothetical protein
MPDREDELVAAVGKASEALEYVERARGHLYSLHQLIGRADFLFEEAAHMLDELGEGEVAEHLRADIVGRNLLDGRWTFQIVEEFEALYWETVRAAVRGLEEQYCDGRRHLHEARMKEERRTRGRPGHERRPVPEPAVNRRAGSAADTG